MFKRIVLALLSIVFISSCHGQRFPEVVDPSARINISGVSVLPPQEQNWKVSHMSENVISLIKKGSQPDATYASFVGFHELPDLESKEQFSKEIFKMLLSEIDTERFTIKKNEGEISHSRETYCWRYHMISEDRAAKTRPGQKVMLLEMVGYICQHPKDRNKGVNFQYSHRYYPGDEDPEIKNKAKEFLDNVTFTDFNFASGTPKAENNAEPYYNRGLAYLRKSQYDEAITEFNKAIEINPRYSLAYNDRGYAYLNKRQYDRAISDFTKAIEIKPRYHKAYNNRAVSYYYKGEYDRAWEDVQKAHSLGFQVHPNFLNDLRKASGREK